MTQSVNKCCKLYWRLWININYALTFCVVKWNSVKQVCITISIASSSLSTMEVLYNEICCIFKSSCILALDSWQLRNSMWNVENLDIYSFDCHGENSPKFFLAHQWCSFGHGMKCVMGLLLQHPYLVGYVLTNQSQYLKHSVESFSVNYTCFLGSDWLNS
jgi:hypothetical protein